MSSVRITLYLNYKQDNSLVNWIWLTFCLLPYFYDLPIIGQRMDINCKVFYAGCQELPKLQLISMTDMSRCDRMDLSVNFIKGLWVTFCKVTYAMLWTSRIVWSLMSPFCWWWKKLRGQFTCHLGSIMEESCCKWPFLQSQQRQGHQCCLLTCLMLSMIANTL